MHSRPAIVFLALLIVAPVSGLAGQAQKPPQKPPVKTVPKAPVKKPAPVAPKVAPEPPPPPDLAVSAKYVSGEKTTTGSVLLQRSRQRVDYESGFASIQQCDQHRALQLNPQTRTYLVMPYDAGAQTAPAPAAGKQKGGTVNYTTKVVDTGERKQMFGFTARHLKTTVLKESSPDACDKKPEQVEMDGWYIDLPATTTCPAAPAPVSEVRIDPKDASCRDTVSYVRPAGASGYPVAYTMTASSGTDAPAVTTMEATEIKRLVADPQRFDVPAGYVTVKTPLQLTADHRPGEDGPKKAGVLRVGVAPLGNTSGQAASMSELTEALIESFGEAEVDAVLLRGTTPAERDAEAKARSCDLILQNTLSEMKRPGRSMLGKISGTSPEGFAAKVEFTLVVPGTPKPVMSSSEKSGTSMLQTAVGAAKRISQFVTPLGYMKAFTAMSGNTGAGMMQQTPDPVVSSMFSLLDKATGAKPQPVLGSEDAAAAAALMKEVESVVAQLKKKKST
jgi:hypothetical protein